MYIVKTMLALAFEAGEDPKWPSEAHQRIAENLLLGNRAIDNRETLIEQGKLIRGLTEEEAKTITFTGCIQKGILIPQ